MIGDKLGEVLVPGDHDHAESLFLGQAGIGAHQVIGLVSQFLDNGGCSGPRSPALISGIWAASSSGIGRPVGLILLIHLMAEGGAFDVKKDRGVFRLFFLEQFEQDPGESEGGIGGVPLPEVARLRMAWNAR